MRSFVVFTLLASVAIPGANAEPVKKGRVLCEGASCKSHDVPTGSVTEFAEDLAERVKLRVEIAKGQETTVASKKKLAKRRDRIKLTQSAPVAVSPELTNLPAYHQGLNRSEAEASEKVVFVPKSSIPKLKGLKSGDVVWAVIEQEILASPGVPSPIRAMAVGGIYKGGIFLGEATLDRELKRVLFTFSKLRLKDRDEVYAVRAAGLSPRGSVGLEGEYVSQTGKFFIAELASAAAAGFVDATVNRSQTSFGTFVQEPSLSNSGKTAAVTALSKTTERMAEAVRNAPEYTRVAGYQELQIIIQDDPAESGT